MLSWISTAAPYVPSRGSVIPSLRRAPASEQTDGHLYIRHNGSAIESCYPSRSADRNGQTSHLRVFDFSTDYRSPSQDLSAYDPAELSDLKDVVVHTTQPPKWRIPSIAVGAWDETPPVLAFTEKLPTVAILTSETGTPLAFNYRPADSTDPSMRANYVVGALQSDPEGSIDSQTAVHRFLMIHWRGERDFTVVDSPTSTDEAQIEANRTACITALTEYAMELEDKDAHNPFLAAETAEKRREVESRISSWGADEFRDTEADALLTSGLAGIRRVYAPADGQKALEWN